MKCMHCKSERLAELRARCKDQFHWKSDKMEYDGYAHVPGSLIGMGDDVEFTYCLDCGRIQGEFPQPSEWTKEELGE